MSEIPETSQPTPRRRWRPRFSLLTLVLGVLLAGSGMFLCTHWDSWTIVRDWEIDLGSD